MTGVRNPVERYLAEVQRQLTAELSFLDSPDKVAEIVIAALGRSNGNLRAAIRKETIAETTKFISHSIGKARTTARYEGWRTPEATRAFNRCREYTRAVLRRLNEGRDPFPPLEKREPPPAEEPATEA